MDAVSSLEENGKFYLINSNGDREKVKCTREYCDRVYGGDYYCNYEVGCVLVSLQKTCGNGLCCEEGSGYDIQKCRPDLTCCKEFSNPLIGECKTTCTSNPTSTQTNNSSINYTPILFIAGAIIIRFVIIAVVLVLILRSKRK